MKSFLHITCGRFYTIRCAMAAESFRRNGGWFTPEDIANDRAILSRLNTIAFVCTSKRKKEGGGGAKLKRRAKLAGNLGTELYPQPFLHPTITARWDTNSLCCCSCFWIPIWKNAEAFCLFVCLFVCFGCLISGLNTTIFRDVTDM